MRRGAALLGLGALAPMLEGALRPFVPAGLCPDLGFLLVLAVGLSWRSAVGGLLLAASTGFVSDLLSGSLLGQHALLYVMAFGAARNASQHINLRSTGPQVVFAAIVTVLEALAMGALTAFFSRGGGLGAITPGELVLRAGANGLSAPLVVQLVGFAVARLGDDEAGRRVLRLEPRKFSVWSVRTAAAGGSAPGASRRSPRVCRCSPRASYSSSGCSSRACSSSSSC